MNDISGWDYLKVRPRRRATSRVKHRILQGGQPVQSQWPQFAEAIAIDEAYGALPLPPPHFRSPLAEIERRVDDGDGTVKWLLQTADSHRIETVLIPGRASSRATACVSSQVGCGVKCGFCTTGTLGLIRSLTADEILEQLRLTRVQAAAMGRRLRNVVFMGMGEPLHNWNAVSEAILFMLRDDGFYISPAHLCVSTAGVTAGLWQAACEFPAIRLAISLHSCDEAVRRLLVPRGVSPLPALREMLRQISDRWPERTLWLEVVLLAGVTDRLADAEMLIEFCRGINAEINLIPYNAGVSASESPGVLPVLAPDELSSRLDDQLGPFRRPAAESIDRFANRLRDAGLFTTIRYSGGQGIAAGCGQLAAGKA